MGKGRDVRCGFWNKAASIALEDEGGVIRCISSKALDVNPKLGCKDVPCDFWKY